MSHDKSSVDERLLVGRDNWEVPLCVDVRAYLRFSRRMDSQLRRLLARSARAASARLPGMEPR